MTDPSTTPAPGLAEPAPVRFVPSPYLPLPRSGQGPLAEARPGWEPGPGDSEVVDGPAPDAALDLSEESALEQQPEDGVGQDRGEGTDEQPDAGADHQSDHESEEESDGEPEPEAPSRFEELVEERLRRAHYAHHLMRRVLTAEEQLLSTAVERRASVWVPTITFGAAVVSAVAAVVLASRLGSDPTDPGGGQLLVVTLTVCLLAGSFVTLLRAELHYDRLRPRGRLVRNDVADAYETVRDAPRRLVANAAPRAVLVRVAGLLPPAEQLVDALAGYTADGGSRVRAHPAYERLLRMRAEVEALELLLAECEDAPSGGDADEQRALLPTAQEMPDFAGLGDLADGLLASTDD